MTAPKWTASTASANNLFIYGDVTVGTMETDSVVGRGMAGPEINQSTESDQVYVFPVTFAQLRLLFLYELDPTSTSYNIPWSIRITG